jgi:hypothetical protein
MNKPTTIYVELLEEGTDCWRPVESEHLGGDLYRITGEVPDDEVWAFGPGSIVKCRVQTFSEGRPALVAYEGTQGKNGAEA